MIDINEGFNILSNGYFYDQNDVINNGYWSWEKLAELVPYDYTLYEGKSELSEY